MTEQQTKLRKYLKRNYTIRRLSKITNIDPTRLWRVLNIDAEMRVGEYLTLFKIYRRERGLDINELFFFIGEDDESNNNNQIAGRV